MVSQRLVSNESLGSLFSPLTHTHTPLQEPHKNNGKSLLHKEVLLTNVNIPETNLTGFPYCNVNQIRATKQGILTAGFKLELDERGVKMLRLGQTHAWSEVELSQELGNL